MVSWKRTSSLHPSSSELLSHGVSLWFACLMLLAMMSVRNREAILVQAAWMGGSVAKPMPHLSSCPTDMVRYFMLLYLSFSSMVSDYFLLSHFSMAISKIFPRRTSCHCYRRPPSYHDDLTAINGRKQDVILRLLNLL